MRMVGKSWLGLSILLLMGGVSLEGRPAQGQPGRLARLRDRYADRSPLPQLPANLDQIPVTMTKDRVNLTLLASETELGEPLSTAQLEELFRQEIDSSGNRKPAEPISDDQFIRRAYLDIIGRLPAPADIHEYLQDKSATKKARLIDRLLSTPQYGVNWARYWRDVVRYRAPDALERPSLFGEEAWLAEEFNQNTRWDVIVTKILTARGLSHEVPQGFFLTMYRDDQAEAAGEISRIFLGTQISCAQCHDHPSDTWKRDQFHELASFLGKSIARPRPDLRDKTGIRFVAEITDAPLFKQYRKPDLDNPSNPGTFVQPVFLTGQALPMETSDTQRRAALAAFVTSKRNPLFAKAFVNRMWAELIGHPFTERVDDLGAQQAVAYPEVFEALSRSFAASDYDIKALLRVILNSDIYDRKFEENTGSLADERLFETINPTRLTADQIFDALDWVLGNLDNGQQLNLPRRPSPRGSVAQVFGYDPSMSQEEIEGSIPQALALMNNPGIQTRISASTSGSLLQKLLATQTNDKELIEMLYLRTLARKPTSAETATCQSYVRKIGDRAEAYEDILWSLLNSTEFLHNH